jgi:hypothetical protein
MNDSRRFVLGFSALVALIVAVPVSIMSLTDSVTTPASAVSPPVVAQAPEVTSPSASPGAPSGDTAAALAIVGVFAGLLTVVGIGVKMFDLKRKRQAEAVHLQAQLSDALLREGGLSLTPTAHIPLWAGGPVTVEVSGPPSSPEGREAALQLVEREAARIRPDVRVIDRIQRAA